jgi:hypothetical protein
MSDAELSKRIDNLHRRFEDFRSDHLQVRQELVQIRQEIRNGNSALRQEMQAGHGALRQEIGELRQSQDGKFTLMIQVMTAGLTVLALLMTAYRFIRV